MYDNILEVDLDKLSKKYVIKPTHTSWFVIIVKDKSKVNKQAILSQAKNDKKIIFILDMENGGIQI